MTQVVFFFPLTEPDNGDDHTIFQNDMLLSPSRTEFRALSQAETLQQLYASLDDELPNRRARFQETDNEALVQGDTKYGPPDSDGIHTSDGSNSYVSSRCARAPACPPASCKPSLQCDGWRR
jgi:hypothetical protein